MTKKDMGRPPKYGEKMKRISLYLPLSMVEKFREMAKEKGLTQTEIFIELLKYFDGK